MLWSVISFLARVCYAVGGAKWSVFCEKYARQRFFARKTTLIDTISAQKGSRWSTRPSRPVNHLRQAAVPMRYLDYSESALLNSIRLSEGAKRMSLPVYTASEQRKWVITSASWACCLPENLPNPSAYPCSRLTVQEFALELT